MLAARPALAAAALAAAAWPSPGDAFTCPARGGRPWREVASEHFVVSTDLTSSEAADLVRELEVLRAAVLAALFENPPPTPGRLGVVAFRSQGDFEDLAPEGAGAYYAPPWGVQPPLVVLPGLRTYEGRDLSGRMLAHELAHYFSSFVLLRQPGWLREGLASYLESLGVAAAGARMRVVPQIPHRRLRMRRDRVPLRDLLGWNGSVSGDASDDARHYDSAWMLVLDLFGSHPRELGDLLARLARAEPPRDAWRAAFPGWDPDRPGALDPLEEELDRLAWAGSYAEYQTRGEMAPRISERPMQPAEVHAIRLLLWKYGSRKRDRAALEAEVAEALGEDPGDPVALWTQVGLGKGEALEAGREAVRLHPGDWRAWELQALETRKQDPGARLAALRRAAELAPDAPLALRALAWGLLATGRSGEALPAARKAARLAPYDSWALETYAVTAADLGMCAEALLGEHRALDVLPDGASGKTRAAFQKRLEAFERQCGPAPAAAPGGEARTPAR